MFMTNSNVTKKVRCHAVEYDPPQVILGQLARLDEEIAEGRRELVEMLG
jgi:type I restriction enzyme M protein